MLDSLLNQYSKMLAECAIAERLRRKPNVELHPTLYNASLVYGPEDARQTMTEIYGEYIQAASDANLPLLITTPTWRVDKDRVREANPKVNPRINTDAAEYMCEVRGMYAKENQPPVLIGGLIGPRNDCYKPSIAPNTAEAQAFHAHQIDELAESSVDFLQAQTLPSVREALGIARVMSRTGKDYVISFCVGTDGRVLDGMSLPDAFGLIDDNSEIKKKPTAYYVNCSHPSFLLNHYHIGELERLKGIQANGSSLDVKSLDNSSATLADPLDDWASAMLELHMKHGVKVLGGCCGTNLPHFRALANG